MFSFSIRHSTTKKAEYIITIRKKIQWDAEDENEEALLTKNRNAQTLQCFNSGNMISRPYQKAILFAPSKSNVGSI